MGQTENLKRRSLHPYSIFRYGMCDNSKNDKCPKFGCFRIPTSKSPVKSSAEKVTNAVFGSTVHQIRGWKLAQLCQLRYKLSLIVVKISTVRSSLRCYCQLA